jgi:hypothetical protein
MTTFFTLPPHDVTYRSRARIFVRERNGHSSLTNGRRTRLTGLSRTSLHAKNFRGARFKEVRIARCQPIVESLAPPKAREALSSQSQGESPMTINRVNDSRHWRDRAAEMRALADWMKDRNGNDAAAGRRLRSSGRPRRRARQRRA